MQYSRLQNGVCGENSAEFESSCVHVVVALPINSKPELQVYVAVPPTELFVNVTKPLLISSGSEHSAAEEDSCQ